MANPRVPGQKRSRPRRVEGAEVPDLFQQKLSQAVEQVFSAKLGDSPHPPSDLTGDPPVAPPEPAIAPAPVKLDPTADPLPARMLNEFVYCPRLFYYEHVEGVFLDNADTIRGSAVHRRVDRGSTALPAAADKPAEAAAAELEQIHSHSVMLSSSRLGVIAKMDLIESQHEPGAGVLEVIPVDYKAGSSRETEEGGELWPTDRMQLGLQCLILRDNGYVCNQGVIYYRGTKQRVPLLISPELEQWIESQIAEARTTAAGPIPPPLVDSPKCVRCSLAPICLPDETRLLSEEKPATDHTPRLLMAARHETRPLYLNTQGLFVGHSDGVLKMKEDKKVVQEVRVNDICHLAIFGKIQVSTQVVQLLCRREIPITWFSMGGHFYGVTHGHSQKNVFTRIEQFRHAADPASALRLAKAFVHGKIRNQRTMLMRNYVELGDAPLLRLKQAAIDAQQAPSLESLLGVEGAAASTYFQHFNGMLKLREAELTAPGANNDLSTPATRAEPEFAFDFTTRNRRPPTDPVNAMLSFAYSLLAKECTIAAAAVGFDPYVGFLHQPRFGRPALALDLMEEFRPLIADSAVLTAINSQHVWPNDFVRAGRAVNLTETGRRSFLNCFEQRMNDTVTHPLFEYKVCYRRAIELQYRILARTLTGEIDEYRPFLTR